MSIFCRYLVLFRSLVIGNTCTINMVKDCSKTDMMSHDLLIKEIYAHCFKKQISICIWFTVCQIDKGKIKLYCARTYYIKVVRKYIEVQEGTS